MLQLKVGIQLASLSQPLLKAINTAAELGVEAVEIDAREEIRPQEISRTGLRQIRKILDDRNLKVCAVTFRTRRGYNVLNELDRRVEATKEAMKLAYDLGAPVVVNQIGRVPSESKGAEWELLLQVLSDLGRYGQKVGAMLAAETGTESGDDMGRLIDALPIGSLGITLDPGNLIINGFSAREATKRLANHILYVHAKDGVRDLAQGRGLEVPLGRGSADFPELLGILEERQYHGYLTIERTPSSTSLYEIGEAVQYLRNLA